MQCLKVAVTPPRASAAFTIGSYMAVPPPASRRSMLLVISDLQSASGKSGIISSIERLDAGGGTAMYEPMVKAAEALGGVTATFKHCIVLTDGVSQPGDFQGITGQMANEQITVSTVAVGQDIDAELLQSIARWGKGRYYQTTDPHDIPQIFAKETMTASKSSL